MTYPDSFVAMEMGPTVGLTYERRPYHGRVFVLSEVPALVEQYGIPDPPWTDEHLDWTTWPEETFVEVQLWSDEPIRSHLE